MYSDLAERDRTKVLEKFRLATINWNQQLNSAVEEGLDESETRKEEKISHLVVVTDVCLPLLSSGESPLSARVLINYELPTKKVGLSLTWLLEVKSRLSKASKKAAGLSSQRCQSIFLKSYNNAWISQDLKNTVKADLMALKLQFMGYLTSLEKPLVYVKAEKLSLRCTLAIELITFV